MKSTIRKRGMLYGGIGSLCLALVLFAGIQFTGCAAANTASAPANQTITQIIAGAGAAASSAQAQYQGGQIPQTLAARTAINTLGAAYNDARAAFLVVLNAEAAYTQAQNAQIAICAPGTSPAAVNGLPITCASATASVATAQAALASANATLTTKANALSAATSAVKALPTK